MAERIPHPAELPGFSPHRFAAWKSLVESGARTSPVEAIASRTLEGIQLKPLFRGEDLRSLVHLGSWPGQPPFLRGRSPLPVPPQVRAEPIAVEPEAWNRLAREELRGGVGSLALLLDRTGAGDQGVSIATAEEISAALDGIDLGASELVLELDKVGSPLAAFALIAPLLTPGARVGFGFDPIAAVLDGSARSEDALDAIVELASRCKQQGFEAVRVAKIDGAIYAEAGGHAVQELAFSLAAGAEILRACLTRRLPVEELARRLELRLSVGPRYFTEVAKLRAARWLWDAVAGSFGARTRVLPLAARPNRFLLSALDPWTNLIRISIACSAALTAGADTIVAQPFDQPLAAPDALSRRIARNQPEILIEEGYLRRVVDPAGGSYFVEWLTGELAREAWTLFQRVEARGGMISAVRDGFVQAELARVRTERARRLSRRTDVLVGVSQYANLAEPRRPGGSRQERPRVGAAFEALREAADRQLERTGRAPSVTLLRAGPIGKLRARVEFARGVLEAGGFQVAPEVGCDQPSLEACLAELRLDGAPSCVVLCALDADLPALCAPLVAALTARTPPCSLVVASRPPGAADDWERAVEGSGGFIHLGAELAASLARLLERGNEVRP